MQIYLCAPILAEMRVNLIGWDSYYLLDNRSTYNYADFLAGCTRLQKLKGNYFTKVMSYGVDSLRYSFMLAHLKVIKLNDVKSGVVKQMSIVARLVSGAPNLQELKIKCDFSPVEYKSDLDSEAPEVSRTDFKCEKLKIVRMKWLSGLPSEIEFLKLLLENSPALERMSVHTFRENKDLRAEILNCHPASSNFTLRFSFEMKAKS